MGHAPQISARGSSMAELYGGAGRQYIFQIYVEQLLYFGNHYHTCTDKFSDVCVRDNSNPFQVQEFPLYTGDDHLYNAGGYNTYPVVCNSCKVTFNQHSFWTDYFQRRQYFQYLLFQAGVFAGKQGNS
jgi:hypothetical protein